MHCVARASIKVWILYGFNEATPTVRKAAMIKTIDNAIRPLFMKRTCKRLLINIANKGEA